jgi:class 3 adenylate cyclase
MTATRRLTAILAADVAGYSRLMGTDEEGTHERLKAHLGELVEPKIKEYRGHTVKNTGDGLLAEFPSVVDAVRCAVEVQRGMADRHAETPEEPPMAPLISASPAPCAPSANPRRGSARKTSGLARRRTGMPNYYTPFI